MGNLLDLFVFKYNRTDFHELNLDWLISDVRTLAETLNNFISINTIKYANPIQWNITTQYEANTVVIDANDGTAYLSVKPVPSGVAITNTDYWTPIFTLNLLSANQNITLRDDGSNVLATFASVAGDWLIWNGVLYRVTQPINVNEAYVIGYNIKRYTVELFIKDYITAVENIIGDLNNLTTADKTSIVNAINEINTLSNLPKIYVCDTRADVANVDAPIGAYIVALNAYASDGLISFYTVTNGVADGYLNISMTNGNCAELNYNNTVHAHQIGAFPDGNDCTAAIDYVLKNVPNVTVKFGNGTYSFNNRIWLNDNQSIIGCGSDTILYCAQDPVGNHGEFIGIIGENGSVKKNITLRNFDIDMYYLPSATEDVNPIGCVSAKNVLIEGVNVLRSNWRGFQFEGEANGILENVTVRNCKISNTYLNGVGLSHAAGGSLKNILFDNVIVENSNSNAGFWVQGASSNDINMTNISFKNIAYSGGTVRALYLANAKNVTIDGLYVSNVDPSIYALIQVQYGGSIRLNNVTMLCDSANANNWGVMLYGVDHCIINGLIANNATIGVQIQNDSDNVILSNSDINIKTGGTPIRNQVATLKGYIAACIYNGTISNASTNFKELT